MFYVSDPRYQYCARVGRSIRICRSEAECRHEFGCTEPDCPLASAFGLEEFDKRMKAYATEFDLWPLGRDGQKDYP
jgi:hypothetical protein